MKNSTVAIAFIVWFVASYIVLTVIYQLVLIWFEPNADPITTAVTYGTKMLFTNADFKALKNTPGYLFLINNKSVVNIKEGCNGMAVFITLVSFCIAFKGNIKSYVWFMPLAFLLLQLSNLLRLYVLINIQIFKPQWFNFFHVYAFPAVIYLMAFGLMVWWVKKLSNA